MPIPLFDHNNVLPPHLGDPTASTDLSPYECTTLELCERFSTSPERIKILENFLLFRIRINTLGITNGFQWLDGSFIENIEVSELRQPNDLDLITFYGNLTSAEQDRINTVFPDFFSPHESKKNYSLDHYPVDYTFRPDVTVDMTRYWIQLFTHNRNKIWKGILRISLNTPSIDREAFKFLNALSL